MIHINWNHFTHDHALLGGLLIGLAVALLILVNGKIAGISGIISGLLTPSKGNVLWRIAFVTGIFTASIWLESFWDLADVSIGTSWIFLVIAGFFVGLGARMGSGCTSGHGVCGVSRLSKRSIVATPGFMISGFITSHIFQQFFI